MVGNEFVVQVRVHGTGTRSFLQFFVRSKGVQFDVAEGLIVSACDLGGIGCISIAQAGKEICS